MHRKFNGLDIRQNSKTGFFNLNDLLNCYLLENPESTKRVENYMRLQQTQEFQDAILDEIVFQNVHKSGELSIPLIERPKLVDTRRGKQGGTWAHPYIFLDFAMWLNPKFKLWAMKVIDDKLIELRNEAGDRFKEMTGALKSSGAFSPREYIQECTMLNFLVFGNSTKEQRNSASQEELTLLNKLQKYNAHLIDQKMTYTTRKRECESFVKFYQFLK